MRTHFRLIVLVAALGVVAIGSFAGPVRERNERIGTILSSVLPPNVISALQPDGKCGTRLSQAVIDAQPLLNIQQQNEIRSLMSAQAYQKIRLIGRFEIHYDTAGTDAPAMLDGNGDRIPNTVEEYVDSVGRYFNYAYAIEVDSLNFESPPLVSGHSGYEIDIRELNLDLYGQTLTQDQVNPGSFPGKYNCLIEIDNDYRGFYSSGIAGLRVTSAHEFHHVIQFGSYAAWGVEYAWFYEITATWMEDYVHTDVNDYYNYVRTPAGNPRGTFDHPEYSFTMANGLIEYSRAIFGKYIEQRFSPSMMLHIWDHIRTRTVLPAINAALTDSASSFQKAFLEWTEWNYHTGHRSDPVHYYSEGLEYGEVRERDTTFYYSPSGYLRDSVQSLGSVYRPILLNGSRKIYTIVSNVNASSGSPFSYVPFTYLMADTADGTYKHLDSLIYVKLDVADPINWKSQESVPSVPLVVPEGGEAFVYPNPFYSPWTVGMTFAVPATNATTGHLLIFSPSMRIVVDRDFPIVADLNGRPAMLWKVDADNPASGVYIYRATVGDKSYQGKISIVRR